MHIIISCHGIGFNISSTKVIVLLQDSQNIFLPLQLRHFRVDRYVVLRKDQGLFSYQNTFSVQHKSRIVIPNKVSHVTSQKKIGYRWGVVFPLQFKQTTYLPTDYNYLSDPLFSANLGVFHHKFHPLEKHPNNNKTPHRNQGIPDWSWCHSCLLSIQGLSFHPLYKMCEAKHIFCDRKNVVSWSSAVVGLNFEQEWIATSPNKKLKTNLSSIAKPYYNFKVSSRF